MYPTHILCLCVALARLAVVWTSFELQVCKDGVETQGSRQRFWVAIPSNGSPVLTDIFSTKGEVHAIFNTRDGVCRNCPKGRWEELRWWFKFENYTEEAHRPSNDPHFHTLIVSCPLKADSQSSSQHNVPMHVSIEAINKTSNTSIGFNNIGFCRYPDDRADESKFKYHLGACTSVVGAHMFRVPEWIVYHIHQGWEHFYVYANEDPSAARTLLDPFIKMGIVDVIDFEWPRGSADFLQQIVAENSCLTRYRGLARWVSMSDVDEFFQPMKPNTVAQFLHQHHTSHHISTFRFQSYLFGSQDNPDGNTATHKSAETQSFPESLCMMQFVFREPYPDHLRVKTIVQPLCLTYFSVHDVTLGSPSREYFGESEIRVAHYKTPRLSLHHVLDTSMSEYAGAIGQDLIKHGFSNHSVPEAAWSAFWVPWP